MRPLLRPGLTRGAARGHRQLSRVLLAPAWHFTAADGVAHGDVTVLPSLGVVHGEAPGPLGAAGVAAVVLGLGRAAVRERDGLGVRVPGSIRFPFKKTYAIYSGTI